LKKKEERLLYYSDLSHTVQECGDTVLRLTLTLIQFLGVCKAFPYPESFVCWSRGDCCLLRTETHVQHPALVPNQLTNTQHGGKLPNGHLVFWISVGRDHLAVFTVPCYGRYLEKSGHNKLSSLRN